MDSTVTQDSGGTLESTCRMESSDGTIESSCRMESSAGTKESPCSCVAIMSRINSRITFTV